MHKVHFEMRLMPPLYVVRILLFEAQNGPCLISSMNLGTLPNKFEKFLAGVCPERYASNVYGSITPKFINQNFDTMPLFD